MQARPGAGSRAGSGASRLELVEEVVTQPAAWGLIDEAKVEIARCRRTTLTGSPRRPGASTCGEARAWLQYVEDLL